MQVNRVDSCGNTNDDDGRSIVSFGALLAGNARARQMFPALSLASPADVAAIQRA